MSALQANDPDASYWVTVYLITALIPHLRVLGGFSRSCFWLTVGLVFAGLLQSYSDFIKFIYAGNIELLIAPMTDDVPVIEHAREFLGLLFSVVCLIVYKTDN